MKKVSTESKNVSKDTPSLKVMHWNAEGVSPKADALNLFLRDHNIYISSYLYAENSPPKT